MSGTIRRFTRACDFSKKEKVTPQIRAQKAIKKTKESISSTIESNSTNTRLTLNQIQEIVIKPSDKYYRHMSGSMQCPAPGLAGLIGFTVPRPAYGCTYDISQSTSANIKTINESIVDKKEEIFNAIKNSIIEKTKLKGDEIPDINTALTDEETEIINDEIEKSLRSLVETTKTDLQSDVIEYSTPIACNCDGDNPVIDQETHAKILVDGLYEDISRRIEEKTSKKLLDSSFSISKSGSLSREIICLVQVITCCICCLGFGFILFKLVDRGSSVAAAQKLSYISGGALYGMKGLLRRKRLFLK